MADYFTVNILMRISEKCDLRALYVVLYHAPESGYKKTLFEYPQTEMGPIKNNLAKARFFGFAFFLMPLVLGARGDFEHPNSFIGNAGWSGGLELWIEVGDVSLGGGASLPLRLRFSSAVKRENSLFGAHWWCPLLESKEKAGADGVKFSTLGGGARLLLKSEDLRSNDRVASAHEGDGFLEISSEKWRYRYRDGKIAEAVTPGGARLVWQYQDGYPTAIRRESDGAELLGVSRTSDGTKVSFGDVVFTMPENAVMNLPDGRRIEIAPDGPDVSKMTISSGGASDEVFRWNTPTGALLSDNDFTYEVRRTDMGRDILHRVDRGGRTEWYTFDTARGLATYKRQDGSRVWSWYHVSPGPTYMKPFRMDTLSKDQQLISSRLLAYDAEGNVEKEWTEQGTASQEKIPGVRYIGVEEAGRLHGQPGVVFIDARKKDVFDWGHIPGAVHIGQSSFEADVCFLKNRLTVADTLVVYCTSRQCEESSIVATKLAQLGHKNVLVFEGGWAEWWKGHR